MEYNGIKTAILLVNQVLGKTKCLILRVGSVKKSYSFKFFYLSADCVTL